MLVVAGLVTEIVYLIAVARLPLWRHGGRLVGWSDLLGGRQHSPVGLVAVLSILVAGYLGGWYLLARRPHLPKHRIVIWSGAIVFSVTLVGLMPFTADLFTYLSQAHSLTDLRINPLFTAPMSAGADPLLAAYGTVYLSQPSAYGPVWVLLSAVGTLGPYDVGWGLLYLKALCVLSFLGCAWLLEKILQAIQPQRALLGLYLFAWNPLILLMAAGDAHNDIVMMLGVLLAFWLLLQEAWVPSFVVLTLSVLIKYVSIIFAAPFALYMWQVAPNRERLGALVRVAVAALVVFLVFSLPLLLFGEPRNLSDPWFLQLVSRFLRPRNWPRRYADMATWILVLGAVLFLAGYAILLWRFVVHRGRLPQLALSKFMDLSFVLSLLAFLFGLARSQPWHLIWPAALAGLSSKRWAWPVTAGLSIVLLASQVWVEWGAPGLPLQF
jgi:hypothetical protein